MSEEREVLLAGGPRDGQPVRYEPDLLKRANMDLGPFVNTPRTREHGGRYIQRRYAHESGVLELYVLFADGEGED